MFLDNLLSYEELDPRGIFLQLTKISKKLNDTLNICQKNPLDLPEGIQKIVLAGLKDFCNLAKVFLTKDKFKKSPSLEIIEYQALSEKDFSDVSFLIIDSFSIENEMDALIKRIKSSNVKKLVLVTAKSELSGYTTDQIVSWIVPQSQGVFERLAASAVVCLIILEKYSGEIDSALEINRLISNTENLLTKIDIKIPAFNNPAKRLAGQLMGRLINLVINDDLSFVGIYWQTELLRLAKNFAFCSELSRIDPDDLTQIYFPEYLVEKAFYLFLRDPIDESIDDSKSGLMEEKFGLIHGTLLSCGIATDQVTAQGENNLSRKWNLLLLGSSVAYYLAIANGVTIDT